MLPTQPSRMRHGAALMLPVIVSLLASPATRAWSQEAWSLEKVVADALSDHPVVVAARYRVLSAEGLSADAGRWQNPVLTLSGESLRPGADDFDVSTDAELFAFVSQSFETAGKRGHRRRAAEQDVEIAKLDLQWVEREVVYRVQIAFESTVAAQQKLALTKDSSERLEQLVELNRVRSAEGYVSEGDFIKSQLESRRFAYGQKRAELLLAQAKIRLLQSLGRTQFETDFTLAASEPLVDSPDEDELRAQVSRRPEILRAEASVARATASSELANALAYPNLTTQLGYKRNGPDNTLYAGLVVPLPVFDRNQGGILSGRAELAAAEAELTVTRSRALGELEAALEGVRQTREQVEGLRASFIEQADASLEIAMAAYREGASDLLVVLEAERTRNAAQELVVDAMLQYRLAIHELERSSGGPVVETLLETTEEIGR